MKKIPSPFKKIDELAFKGIDNLQSQPKFQQLLGQLESLPDDQMKWVNQALSYLVILLPLCLLILAGTYNLGVRSDLETITNIHSQLQKLNQKSQEANLVGRSIVGQRLLNTRADFEGIIRALIRQKKLDSSKVRLLSFEQASPQGNVQKSMAKITFEKFSSEEFTNLLHGITIIHKIKIEHIETDLDSQSSQLKGILKLLYFSKMRTNENTKK